MIDEQLNRSCAEDAAESAQESSEGAEKNCAQGETPGYGNAEDAACEKPEAEPELKDEEDLNTKYMRLAADFQNFRRRTDKEKSDIYAYANEKIASELLEVVDNFERAMEHAEQSPDPKLAEGMALILKQLGGVLEKNGVEEIAALGELFDPAFHNAVMTEAAEDAKSGTVTKVFQKGYMLNKKVIRPSMVAVAQQEV